MVRAGRLPLALSDLGAASVGGRIIAVGGRDATGRVHADILSFAMRRRALIVLASPLLLAGCGGGSRPARSLSPAPTPTPTVRVTPAPSGGRQPPMARVDVTGTAVPGC